MFRGVFLAYVLCVFSSSGAAAADRVREMAECGYLAHVAVEQMKKRDTRPEIYDDVVGNVIDFTNLYYLLSDTPRPWDEPGITAEMLVTVVNRGRDIHNKRTLAMSPQNALRLSNRVLSDCRADLSLFARKYATE